MPRTARLDIAGVLHHVIVRGVEQRDIFLDDTDRQSFLDRFSKLLVQTETECLAWSLMTNHVHMLLRPTESKLGHFMRRLLTGHAVTFNLRHHRSGHLFQNRFKSIICEEDPYVGEQQRLRPQKALSVILAAAGSGTAGKQSLRHWASPAPVYAGAHPAGLHWLHRIEVNGVTL